MTIIINFILNTNVIIISFYLINSFQIFIYNGRMRNLKTFYHTNFQNFLLYNRSSKSPLLMIIETCTDFLNFYCNFWYFCKIGTYFNHLTEIFKGLQCFSNKQLNAIFEVFGVCSNNCFCWFL